MDKDDGSARREKWARLRFAVVGPLLASPPPPGQLGAELERLSQREWEHPSGTGPVRLRSRRSSAGTSVPWKGTVPQRVRIPPGNCRSGR